MPRYFTDEHEWIDVEGDSATVGITGRCRCGRKCEGR